MTRLRWVARKRSVGPSGSGVKVSAMAPRSGSATVSHNSAASAIPGNPAEKKANCHDVAPVQPVGEPRDRDAEGRVEQHEAEAREQAHGGVGEQELLLDRL